jgi:hypothetical protein
MTEQSFDAFEADLRRAFAGIEDPADDGFAMAVSRRVARRERGAELGVWARAAAFAVAGAAGATAVFALAQTAGPMLMAQFGMTFVTVQSALAAGDWSTGAASMVMTQALLALGLGAGGVAAYRAVAD